MLVLAGNDVSHKPNDNLQRPEGSVSSRYNGECLILERVEWVRLVDARLEYAEQAVYNVLLC